MQFQKQFDSTRLVSKQKRETQFDQNSRDFRPQADMKKAEPLDFLQQPGLCFLSLNMMNRTYRSTVLNIITRELRPC